FRGMVTAAIPPVPLHVVKQGRILVLLPDRLLEFNAENPDEPRTFTLRTAGQSRLERFLGMGIAADGTLWIAGTRGLSHAPVGVRKVKRDTEWRDYFPPPTLLAVNFQQPLADADGNSITCVAESPAGDQKLAVHFDGENWSSLPAGTEKVRGAWRGREGF